MHFFIGMLCTLTLLFGIGNSPKYFSEKLVVFNSKNESITQEELLKLKVYFIENPTTRSLQEKYDLQLEIEHLSDYDMVVIKPIPSLAVRNTLILTLTPMFQDMFFIDDEKYENGMVQKIDKPQVKLAQLNKKKEISLIDEIGLQWLALLLLSFIGLILSIASRRKLIHIGKKQKDIKVEQKKIETEIKQLGAEDA